MRTLFSGLLNKGGDRRAWIKSTATMRLISMPFLFLSIVCLSLAETRVTVAQLEQFLNSRSASKESDAQLAELLGTVIPSEQLTPATLARIVRNVNLGPQSAEQLELLASSSIFEPPPQIELPRNPPPNAASQQQMIISAEEYVNNLLHSLPDFLVVRETSSFDNAPRSAGRKSAKQKPILHFLGETRRDVTYRNGHEVESTSGSTFAAFGLTTWGEFGPILKIVLSDSFQGSVRWRRWQTSETGRRVAVFEYAVLKPASHYLIDFCCYQVSKNDPVSYPFRDHPAYHGELYIDPATGAVDRIIVEADLAGGDPLINSEIAVQYGRVDIGGKSYICPIHGVAISTVHNLQMKVQDGTGLEKHINIVHFLDYHKFGSTARILTGDPQTISR